MYAVHIARHVYIAVFTYLPYLSLYLLYVHVPYLLLSRTYFVLLYVGTALLIYVPLYVVTAPLMCVRYILKRISSAPTVCTHVLHLLMYVLHVPTVDARTYIEGKNTTSCCKYVPTAVRTYLLHPPDTRVPTDVRTHLLHILLFLLMHVRTHK